MKFLYSQIKELVPGLKAEPKELADDLTMIGFMCDSFEKVKYQGKPDYLIGLEVRENRGDMLSILGIAREAAAFHGLTVKEPASDLVLPKKATTKIKVEKSAQKLVTRALAVMIKDVKNTESPTWLKEYMEFYEMNPTNLMVDLSNYVMILTGYPSHLLDMDKMQSGLIWDMNNEFEKIVTLDGTEVPLSKKNEILLRDTENILGLAGMVGGRQAAMELNSKNVLVEMAIYDHATVRDNVRSLKVFTEAGSRLGKDLDINAMGEAFQLLIDLLLKHGGGQLEPEIFEHFPKKRVYPKIKMDLAAPSQYAGIEIKEKQALESLKRLGFEIVGQGKARKSGVNSSANGRISGNANSSAQKAALSWVEVLPPKGRTDVNITEDVIEEVVRMADFRNIPIDETPALEVVPKITPLNIILAEKIRDVLTANGYDEIMSLPLVAGSANEAVNYLPWEEIKVQNPINEEFPCLRQSLAAGLFNQLLVYTKKNIPFEQTQIFEIGKVFGKEKGKYLEHETFAALSLSEKNLTAFKDKCLRKSPARPRRSEKSLMFQLKTRRLKPILAVVLKYGWLYQKLAHQTPKTSRLTRKRKTNPWG